jgi:hypothetical protein
MRMWSLLLFLFLWFCCLRLRKSVTPSHLPPRGNWIVYCTVYNSIQLPVKDCEVIHKHYWRSLHLFFSSIPPSASKNKNKSARHKRRKRRRRRRRWKNTGRWDNDNQRGFKWSAEVRWWNLVEMWTSGSRTVMHTCSVLLMSWLLSYSDAAAHVVVAVVQHRESMSHSAGRRIHKTEAVYSNSTFPLYSACLPDGWRHLKIIE